MMRTEEQRREREENGESEPGREERMERKMRDVECKRSERRERDKERRVEESMCGVFGCVRGGFMHCALSFMCSCPKGQAG